MSSPKKWSLAGLLAPPSITRRTARLEFYRLSEDFFYFIVSGESNTYSLVFPTEADSEEGKISVLAPIGTAILGYRQGDTIEWPVPSGVRKLKVEEILYQPESSGDDEL
jgi:hypothetical protein